MCAAGLRANRHSDWCTPTCRAVLACTTAARSATLALTASRPATCSRRPTTCSSRLRRLRRARHVPPESSWRGRAEAVRMLDGGTRELIAELARHLLRFRARVVGAAVLMILAKVA